MKIKELLKTKSRWCKYAAAKAKDGFYVHPDDPEAKSWCLVGAVNRCYSTFDKQQEVMSKLNMSLWPRTIERWNDDYFRTFEEVKALVEELNV